jgi:hypothetical protein
MNNDINEKRLQDLERALLLAYKYLLKNQTNESLRILEDQINKSYE